MMNGKIHDLERPLREALARGDVQAALWGVRDAILKLAYVPDSAMPREELWALQRALDGVCQEAGRLALQRLGLAPSAAKRAPDKRLYALTSFYDHADRQIRTLYQLIESAPQAEHVVMVSGECDPASRQRFEAALPHRTLRFHQLAVPWSAETGVQALSDLQRFVAQTQAHTLYLLTHSEDALWAAAASAMPSGHQLLCIQHDEHPSLGASLAGAERLSAQALAPDLLFPDVSGEIYEAHRRELLDGRFLHSASSGDYGQGDEALLRTYGNHLPAILSSTKSAHFHLGFLPYDALNHACLTLMRAGLDPLFFIHRPMVVSQWQTMRALKIGVYIQAPGDTQLLHVWEAMALGLPILMPQTLYESAWPESLRGNYVQPYSEATVRELRMYLRGLKWTNWAEQGAQARRAYEQHAALHFVKNISPK